MPISLLSRGIDSLRSHRSEPIIYIHNFRRPLRERLKSRQHVGPYMWKPATPGCGRGFYISQHLLSCDENGSTFDLRLSLANDHLPSYYRLARINGYYCDRDGNGDTLKPIVARLPHNRGFLAGWYMGLGMCASVDGKVYQDAESAAFAAHSMAEYDAEKSRELQYEDEDENEEEN